MKRLQLKSIVLYVIGGIQNSARLGKKDIKISFAETITGGGIAKEIIKIPGSSRVIDFSLTTYSNQSKIDFLKVSENTLINFGAVSEETVEEMVKGLVEISHYNPSTMSGKIRNWR